MPKRAVLPQALQKQNVAPSTSSRGRVTPRRACVELLLLLLPPLVLIRLFGVGGSSLNIMLQEIKSFQKSTIKYASSWSKSSTGAEQILTGPSQSLVQAALEFVKQREQAYRDQQVHPHWKMRGHGHLYTYEKIVLAWHARVSGANKQVLFRYSMSIGKPTK
jgi:hypothetical protein